MKKIIHIILTVGILFQSADATEERYLDPPLLGEDHLGRKKICYRPSRLTGPNISIDRYSDKTVVHNYGHGGAGWSLSYGSVEHIVEKWFKSFKNINQNEPIAVIGAGCIGLMTSYYLREKGFNNIEIYCDSSNDLTSHHAGGLLSFRSYGKESEDFDIIHACALKTYDFFEGIALKKSKNFSEGAKIISTYFENIESSELESFVGKRMNPSKEVIVNFRNGKSHNMIVYDDSIFIDSGKMMEILREKAEKSSCFTYKKINSFDEICQKIVFNCTGLGSRELSNDQLLSPIKGHLIFLKNQNQRDLDYMVIIDDKSCNELDHDIIRTLDFFPKKIPLSSVSDVGVLGGTFIKLPKDSISDDFEFKMIINRAKYFFYGVKM